VLSRRAKRSPLREEVVSLLEDGAVFNAWLKEYNQAAHRGFIYDIKRRA
jgi:hypothetical protein